MPLKTVCPHCDREYTLADEKVGKTVKCKDCGKSFSVAPVEDAVDEVLPAPDPSPELRRPSSPWGPRRRKSKKEDRRLLGITLLVAGVLLLVPCCGVSYFVVKASRLFAPPLNEATLRRIKPGMTSTEVLNMLGDPSYEDITAVSEYQVVAQSPTLKVYRKNKHPIVEAFTYVWKDGDNEIAVNFTHGKADRINGYFVDPKTGVGRKY